MFAVLDREFFTVSRTLPQARPVLLRDAERRAGNHRAALPSVEVFATLVWFTRSEMWVARSCTAIA